MDSDIQKLLTRYVVKGDRDKIHDLIVDMPITNVHKFYGTPFHIAVYFGFGDVVARFLGEGVDPNMPPITGNMSFPLIDASKNASVEVVRLLLGAGANPNITHRTGVTALHMVPGDDDEADGGDVEKIVEMLLGAGANPNMVDERGWTPLHYFVEMGNLELVRIIVDGGANIYAENEEGESPIDMAEGSIREYLEEAMGRGEEISQMRMEDPLEKLLESRRMEMQMEDPRYMEDFRRRQEECSICLDTKVGPKVLTSCNHVFHEGCINRVGGRKCPMCRRGVGELRFSKKKSKKKVNG